VAQAATANNASATTCVVMPRIGFPIVAFSTLSECGLDIGMAKQRSEVAKEPMGLGE
jgi:hypothetical protein